MTPVMVIMIEPELELDELELTEAIASIAGGSSALAGSADPCEKAPPKYRQIPTTPAKHTNLTARLNIPSNYTPQRALDCRDLFPQENPFYKNTPSHCSIAIEKAAPQVL